MTRLFHFKFTKRPSVKGKVACCGGVAAAVPAVSIGRLQSSDPRLGVEMQFIGAVA